MSLIVKGLIRKGIVLAGIVKKGLINIGFWFGGEQPELKDYEFVAAYHGETDKQNVQVEGNVMNLMPKGVIPATSVHSTPIMAPDYQGIYREYPVDNPVWKGGRYVSNLLPYSEDITVDGWSKQNIVVNSKTSYSSISIGYSNVRQAIAVKENTQYTFNLTASSLNASDPAMRVWDLSNTGDLIGDENITLTSVPSVNTKTFTTPTGCTSIAVYSANAASAIGETINDLQFQIYEGLDDQEYIKTEDEPLLLTYHDGLPDVYAQANKAATNLIKWNTDLTNITWYKALTSIQTDTQLAPDGSVCQKIVESVSDGQHALSPAGTNWTQDLSYTYSCYVKPAGRDNISFGFPYAVYGSWIHASFNLLTGAIVFSSPQITASIEPASNGFFRCSIKAIAVTTTANDRGGIKLADSADNTEQGPSYIGDGVSGVYIWGIQLEEGVETPSLPIPTTSAAASIPALDYVYSVANIDPSDTKFGLKIDYQGDTVVMDIGGHKLLEIGDFAGDGTELIVNGDFDTGDLTGWDTPVDANASVTNNIMTLDATAQYGRIDNTFPLLEGVTYIIKGRGGRATSTSAQWKVNSGTGVELFKQAMSADSTTFTGTFTPDQDFPLAHFQQQNLSAGLGTSELEYVSVQKAVKAIKLSDGTNELTHKMSEDSHLVYTTLQADRMQLEVDGVKQTTDYIPITAGVITVSEDHYALHANPSSDLLPPTNINIEHNGTQVTYLGDDVIL